MKVTFQGERVAFTLNLSFGFKFKPSNRVIREFRKQERMNRYKAEKEANEYSKYLNTQDIN